MIYAVGYAVAYVFGTIGIIFLARDIAPRSLGMDLKAKSAEYERKLAGGKVVQKPATVTSGSWFSRLRTKICQVSESGTAWSEGKHDWFIDHNLET